jgi:hypothetical protein
VNCSAQGVYCSETRHTHRLPVVWVHMSLHLISVYSQLHKFPLGFLTGFLIGGCNPGSRVRRNAICDIAIMRLPRLPFCYRDPYREATQSHFTRRLVDAQFVSPRHHTRRVKNSTDQERLHHNFVPYLYLASC